MSRAHTLSEALSQGVGVERPFLCPVHADTRPSASVNVVKGVWYCYTCHAHGEVGGEAMLGEVDFGLVGEYIDTIMAEPKVYPESWLNQFDAAGPGPYWLSRFTPEACEHFRLGQSMEGEPCYPLRDVDGSVHGIVRRTDWSKAKYMYPAGLDIGNYLFNFGWEQQDVLVLAEGAADAIAVWEAGYTAFAIYGSKLSDQQKSLIDCVSPGLIVTVFDQDDAGRSAAVQVAKQFPAVRVGRWPEPLGDIADMSIAMRKRVLDSLAYGGEPRIGSDACSSPLDPRRTLSPGLRPPSLP